MADVSKLKQHTLSRKNELGDPPPINEASNNLTAPELAPMSIQTAEKSFVRIDGRTARKSNRTVQFATRVTAEWDELIRKTALQENILLVEVLEKALTLYIESK